jgi:YD repeat-containing protein
MRDFGLGRVRPPVRRQGRYVAASVTLCILALAGAAAGQTDDRIGLPHRAYEGLLPGESVDTASGRPFLRFVDLVLPGDGWDLRFERVFDARGGTWRFGLGGLPLRLWHAPGDPAPPVFETLDGPMQGNVIWWDTHSVWLTDRFWRYHEDTRTLAFPDGRRAMFDAARRLSQLFDAGGRPLLSLAWQTGQVTVTQYLANGQSREIVVAGTGLTNLPNVLPTTMTYAGRTWQYARTATSTEVTPPMGPPWTFTWTRFSPPSSCAGFVDELDVTLPTGGRVAYQFGITHGPTMQHCTLHTRQLFDAGSQQPFATWSYAYTFVDQDPPHFSQQTTVTGPTVATTYTYGLQPAGFSWDPALQVVLVGRTVVDGAVTLETETRTYISLTTPTLSDLPVLESRTLTRDGVGHVTTYNYGPPPYNFHNPWQIVESSGAVSRTTTLTYAHSFPDHQTWPFYVGVPSGVQVTINGDTTTTTWTYDADLFRTSETVNGLTTTFTPDAAGNVQTITRPNGKTVSFAYSYGQVSQVTTSEPGYGLTRVINPDGTIASETQAGRTTTYEYDDLRRPTHIQAPGGSVVSTPVVIAYDNGSAREVTATRGASWMKETLDAFGRPVTTLDSQGVRTRTKYDAIGRVIEQSYPFEPGVGLGDIHTGIQYDGLNRVTRQTHPDTTSREYVYGPNTVTVRDEEHTAQDPRQTVYTFQAFGHPDDARLVQLQDALGEVWTYSYTVEGAIAQLAGPAGPDSVLRTWNYNHPNRLLASETHPEYSSATTPGSGTVSYTYTQGVLTQRVDAQGTTFTYARDGNDRVTQITAGAQVTTITYESGSDQIASMSVGGVTSTFGLDAAGRLETRTDLVEGKSFETAYAYYPNDALYEITYPSGRRVRFDYDSELRVTRVYRDSGADYATGFTYHPSGALTGYTAGNGLRTDVAYDDERYWTESLTVGEPGLPALFDLTYDYAPTGNVEAITEGHLGRVQQFGYDKLSRLTSVTPSGGYPSATFTYDAHGNRQNNVTYDANNRFRLKTVNGFGDLVYDHNGNLLTQEAGGLFQYSYTPDNRLSAATAGGVTTEFAYAADAWRVKSAVTGGVTTYFVRGPGGELLTEWINTSPTATARDYIYAAGRLIAVAITPVPAK